jgi:sensor histidine kinase YesM
MYDKAVFSGCFEMPKDPFLLNMRTMLKRKLYPELIFSTTYISWSLMFEYLRNGSASPYAVLVIYYFINIALVTSITSFTFPRYYRAKMYLWKLTFAIIVSFLVYALLNYLNESFLSPALYNTTPNLTNFVSYLLPSIPFFVSYSLFGIAIYFFRDSHRKEVTLEKEKANALQAQIEAMEAKSAAMEAIAESSEAKAKQLEAEALNMQLKYENLMLENDYRRAQINPHFLNNTLTTIIGAINNNDPDAGEYVAWLGKIMGYNMREPGADKKVPLADEVDAIELLLRLVARRHKGKYHIYFEKLGSINGQRIIAHILMTLVENALKYGYISEEDKPIEIHLSVIQNSLDFRIKNHIKPNQSRHSNGVGLKNLHRRLELVYNNNFTYDTMNDGTTYTAHLTLTL